MSNRTIAARLYVTERTVEAHITQIFHELNPPESADQHRASSPSWPSSAPDQAVEPERFNGQKDRAFIPARVRRRIRSWDGLVQNPNG
jgi:hypothetical protein